MAEAARWLVEAVAAFGRDAQQKLAGPGDREAAIRAPLEGLLGAAGSALGVPAVFHDEVRDEERRVRPDYGVSVKGLMTGYVEVKAPGRGVDPRGFTGHDKQQWERQRDLPNLLYTNGLDWRLYRDGESWGDPVHLGGGTLDEAGGRLAASAGLEHLLTEFLRWQPAPITSVAALVRAIAPLTRLLRGEVVDQLTLEAAAVQGGRDELDQPFRGLARDWRALLFPDASDAVFADGYAQTVTFALLLARTRGITLSGVSLHQVGAELSEGQPLMGRALQLLTDDVAADFRVTLDLLVRVVDAVDWPRVRKGRRDAYLHLYEYFLEIYDPDLRKASGSYYTPHQVVDEMVRLAEEVLVSRLDRRDGFADPDVLTVDPAMGTGTYLQTILARVADRVRRRDGEGLVAPTLSEIVARVVGFELQMGPYAVAELRANDLLADAGVPLPARTRLYVTNTLDDPFLAETQLSSGLAPIARSRSKANEIKSRSTVTVVIGNPPYRERADGMGAWVEDGGEEHGKRRRGILGDFRLAGNGRTEYVLKNLYIYFWRWATWKVWESTPADEDARAGIVCFISTAGYLRGPGFKGMRKYLRHNASEGWIIDLTPEGQTPDVPTRIFPGVRQPLAIGLFVRGAANDVDVPAAIRYRSVHGRQDDKFTALAEVTLDGDGWRSARTDWTAPLTPGADTAWDDYPALGELMPWVSPGVKANRTWVYAPAESVLQRRWARFTASSEPAERAGLMKTTRDRDLASTNASLLVDDKSSTPLGRETRRDIGCIRVGYRSFDRQWLVADGRVVDFARPSLWATRIPGQIFVVEQHAHPISDGPGVVFSALIPDMDHFKGSEGGRVLPTHHPDGSPNLAPRLLTALSERLGTDVCAEDVLAYTAGLVAHPAYTATFADELTTPGIRVPLTGDVDLWRQAAAMGREVVWLHTYGEAFSGDTRPTGDVRLPPDDPRRPLAVTAITQMPEEMSYDADAATLTLGHGRFAPVSAAVVDYTVGGRRVLGSWFNYRKKEPGGRRSSPLDDINVEQWPSQWSTELLDLLTVLTRLVDLESDQSALLDAVLAGPLLSRDELAGAGVRWPTKAKDRKPRYPMTADGTLMGPNAGHHG